MKIILASGSPRRADLLKQIGYDFKVITSDVDESYDEAMPPAQVVQTLSARKGDAVFNANLPEEDTVVISADTIVALDNKILGKPANEQEAIDMLTSLSGKVHQVYTGVTMYYFVHNKITFDTFVDCANVYFRELTEDEIKAYVATGEPMDKAGAYGIQGKGAILVDKIEGDFYTIVGLPIVKVYKSIQANM